MAENATAPAFDGKKSVHEAFKNSSHSNGIDVLEYKYMFCKALDTKSQNITQNIYAFPDHFMTLPITKFPSQTRYDAPVFQEANMTYKRSQQVLVKIDANNLSGWYPTTTTNMQWIKAVVVASSDTMHTASCILLHYPYNNWPKFQSGWECHYTFNISKVKLLEGDEAGGIQITE
eukprot:1573554-Ditylum_brightwellii.AAC.1